MDNPQTRWRIDFATELSKQLLAFPGIQAIVIAGSVARGYADEYSDVELPIFWETLPSDETRHEIIAALQAELLYTYDGPAREDQLLIRDRQVDFWHISVAHQEEILGAVLDEHRYDLGTLNALDTLRSCIPLYGHKIVERWKLRAQAYPDELAEKIIRDHIASFRTADLFILAKRKNPTAFHAQLSFLQQELFLVLMALNRHYFPTFKWLYRALETMPTKPAAIDRRLRDAFEARPEEAIADTRRVLEETLSLVEDRFPQIDTVSVRRRLRYVRAAHAAPNEIKEPGDSPI